MTASQTTFRTILHVAQPTEGGVAKCVADLVADQVGRGWDVAVASPADGDLHDWTEQRGGHHVEWPSRSRPSWHTAVEIQRLRRIVRDLQPELVHLHGSTAGLAGRLLLRGRRPTVFQPHAWSFFAADGPLRTVSVQWERRAARWAHRIVCVSASEHDHGVQNGIDAAYEVIPNGVDLERFAASGPNGQQSARQQLGLDDVPMAICVGRLHRQKGHRRLLRIWPDVRRQAHDATLVLIGDGPLRDELEADAPEGVVFAGHRDDVARWLAATNLVIMPSRWEGLSLALLEAMASARSLVVTDVAGMREALLDGPLPPAGEVVGDDDELLAAIVRRLCDPALAVSEGVAARERAERSYDRAVSLERHAELTASMIVDRNNESSAHRA